MKVKAIKYLFPLLIIGAIAAGCERQTTPEVYSNTNAPSSVPSTPSGPASTNATPPTPPQP